MNSNETPENRVILLALARSMHHGMLTHGATVGLHHHTAATLLPKILKVDGDPAAPAGDPAQLGSQMVYRECVDATSDAVAALAALSDGEVKAWLSAYRRVMENVHGRRANDGWAAAGFPAGRPLVPRTSAERMGLLTAAGAYLASHAAYAISLPQKDGPAIPVTVARAQALKTQLQDALTLVAARRAEQAACKQTRDSDVQALYREVSAATAELRDLLAANDARWEVFGLNVPAKPTPPLGVASLTLSPAGPGRLLAEWTYAVRATYYRVMVQRMNLDPAPVNVADPKDLECTLKNLPAGTTVQVHVIPMNSAGAGAASPVVSAVAA